MKKQRYNLSIGLTEDVINKKEYLKKRELIFKIFTECSQKKLNYIWFAAMLSFLGFSVSDKEFGKEKGQIALVGIMDYEKFGIVVKATK